MEPNRRLYRLNTALRRNQSGITAIGFLLLAILVGIVGLAVLKVGPLYYQNMRVSRVMEDLEEQFEGGSDVPALIRRDLNNRFAAEGLRVPRESITITQGRDSYQVRIEMENRTPFIADIYFLVALDKSVEIRRR